MPKNTPKKDVNLLNAGPYYIRNLGNDGRYVRVDRTYTPAGTFLTYEKGEATEVSRTLALRGLLL